MPTRREVIIGGGSLAGALLVGGCEPTETAVSRPARMPAVYIPHGGGPWPFVEVGLGDAGEQNRLREYLTALSSVPPATPRALLVVSAHWQERVPTVMTASSPPMLYDYYGFPPASYQLTWPAPGDPALAARVQELLGDAGMESASDARRGFDHGTFVPLKLAYPDAQIPCVQLSLERGMDPEKHLAIGRALRPLRDDGVFIVGSGMSFHDLRTFGRPEGRAAAAEFDRWLGETMSSGAAEREARLRNWEAAPAARRCHPHEDHLIPLMVVAGAAGDERATMPYRDTLAGSRLTAVHFG